MASDLMSFLSSGGPHNLATKSFMRRALQMGAQQAIAREQFS
jgi:hypothetical protein